MGFNNSITLEKMVRRRSPLPIGKNRVDQRIATDT
jgi:hypothetical protein